MLVFDYVSLVDSYEEKSIGKRTGSITELGKVDRESRCSAMEKRNRNNSKTGRKKRC